MATQEILVKYKADVSDLTNQLKTVIERMDKLEAESKSSAKGVDVLTKSVDKLDTELKEIPKDLNKVTPAVKNLGKTATDEGNKLRSSFTSIGREIATGLGLAFSTAVVINFGKAAINAFLEAEENANRLKFAVIEIGNQGEAAFEKLLQQSEELQKITIFSDDSIQQAQTLLATVGLTADEIEKAIPVIADFAAATGKDIVSAAEAFKGGLAGMGREFKRFQIDLDANNTRLENYNLLIDGLGSLQGAAAEATRTLTGELKQQENAADELQEQIGQGLAPAFVRAKVAILDFAKSVLEGLGILRGADAFQANAANRQAAIIAEFEGTVEALVNQGVELDEARQRVNDRLSERLQSEIDRKIGIAEFATEVALLKNELETLEKYNLELENRIKNEARLLTVAQIQSKETAELNKLLKENQDLTDTTSQSNTQRITAELAARKKAADEVKKLQDKAAEEEKARQEKAFEDFKTNLEKEQDELLKVIERAEQRAKDQEALLEFKVRFVANLEGEEAAFQFARDELFKTFQEESIQADVTSDTVTEANAKKQKAYEEYISALTKLVGDFAIFEQKEVEQTQETVVADWINANQEILNASVQLLSDLNNLFDQFAEQRILRIEKDLDVQLKAFDAADEANQESLDKRRISEKDFAQTQKEIAENRARAEREAEKKINDIKRKQFNLDKIAALAEIIIQTAIKVVEAPIPLKPFYIALGAAQGAIVAAQPNPYKKGTKAAKKGLALVDEEGTEAILRGKGRLTTLERGDKVLTASKTKTYGEVLDAMMDGRFEKYVMQKYVAPQLEKQRKISIEKRDNSIAENITRSMVINNMGSGKGDFFLEKMAKQGIIIRNVDDFRDNTRISHKRK